MLVISGILLGIEWILIATMEVIPLPHRLSYAADIGTRQPVRARLYRVTTLRELPSIYGITEGYDRDNIVMTGMCVFIIERVSFFHRFYSIYTVAQ